jgi:hypothetical protein
MGLSRAWQSKAARQSFARQRMLRTATLGARQRTMAHGKATAHGKEASHGSVRSARQRWRRTAKGFAVRSLHAHGKGGFAVEAVAVHTLP